MNPTRPCPLCHGFPDSYEVNGAGQCVGCNDTRIAEVVECDGCEESDRELARYLVTHHDGSESDVFYCADCAGLARMDWNGETKSIRAWSGRKRDVHGAA